MSNNITFTFLRQDEKEIIKKLYIDEKLTINEISKRTNRTCPTIKNYLISQKLYKYKNKRMMNYDEALTQREIQVYNLLLKGCTEIQISQELCIAYSTVKTHTQNILLKKGCHSKINLLIRRIQELERNNNND